MGGARLHHHANRHVLVGTKSSRDSSGQDYEDRCAGWCIGYARRCKHVRSCITMNQCPELLWSRTRIIPSHRHIITLSYHHTIIPSPHHGTISPSIHDINTLLGGPIKQSHCCGSVASAIVRFLAMRIKKNNGIRCRAAQLLRLLWVRY